MSESVFKFFPLEPTRGFHDTEPESLIATIRDNGGTSIDTQSLELHDHSGIQFIDCGSRLERIRCPCCGADFKTDFWQSVMDADFDSESGFALERTLKCQCDYESTLNALNYHAECAFSRAWISVIVHSHFWTGWLSRYPWIGLVEARY